MVHFRDFPLTFPAKPLFFLEISIKIIENRVAVIINVFIRIMTPVRIVIVGQTTAPIVFGCVVITIIHTIEDSITIATRLLKGRIAKQVWRDYHKHAFARRCYADPPDMGLKALQLSGKRREQDQTEREQLQLQHTLLTRLHHNWRRGIG